MQVNANAIKELCRKRGWTLNNLLLKAGVSRTAFYALVRKDNILPKSIQSIAKEMNISPFDILLDQDREIRQARELYNKAMMIAQRHPGVDVDNVRHTLILLEEPCEERLRKGLLRGKTAYFYGQGNQLSS